MANERSLTISGQEFTIALPFEAGHVCTEGEAKALNQTFAEAVRNNMAKKVKDGTAGPAEVTAYANEFVFTIATASANAKYTAEEREARALAKAAIKAKLEGEGRKITDIDADKLEAAIALVAAKPEIVKQAAKIVKQRKDATADLGDLDLGTTTDDTQTEAEAAADEGASTSAE